MCYGNSVLRVPADRLFRFQIYHHGREPNENEYIYVVNAFNVCRVRSEFETIRMLEERGGGGL